MKKPLILGIVAIAFSVGFFAFTNPQDVPVPLLAIPALLTFIIGSCAALIIIRLFRLHANNIRAQRAISVLFGVASSALLVFQSTGGIVVGDILLLGAVLCVAYIYINKY